MKVIIAGAGIGGLTTALCCLKRGIDVAIYEKAAALMEVGAGIQISPNAMRVYQALGLGDIIVSKGFKPEKLETRMGKTGRRLFAIDAQSWDTPYIHIHRADLINILAERFVELSSQSLHTGQTVSEFSQTADHVEILLESGDRVIGDYLVGADGIHSTIRSGLFGADKPRFTGNIAWRATVPTKRLKAWAPDPHATVWMGDQRHAVTYCLRGGELTNFVGVIETPVEMEEGWTRKGTLSELQSDFDNWHPVISTIVENIEPHDLYKWALYDRPPLSEWCRGRVIVIGDAAHPMLPFMAQGAAQAVQDSASLAKILLDIGDRPDRVKEAFEFDRMDQVNAVQARALGNMKTFHRASGLGYLSYVPMWLGGRLAPRLIKSRLNWIYNDNMLAP